MKPIQPIQFVSIILFVLTLAGCASRSNNAIVTDYNTYQLSNQLKLTQRQRADLYEAVIAADIAEQKQDYLTATSYYLFAAEISKNQQLIQKSIEAAKQADDQLGILQASQLWLSIAPNNDQALTSLLEAQIENQYIEDTVETGVRLYQQLNDPLAYYQVLESIITHKDPRIVFNFLRDLEKQLPEEAAIITGQAKFIFNMSNKSENSSKLLLQGLQKAEYALNIDPLFFPAIRLKTHILFQGHQDSQALNFLYSLYQSHPSSAEISHMLGQLLYDMRDYQGCIQHYSHWLAQNPGDLEAINYLAASYYAKAQYQQSAQLFKQLVEQQFQMDVSAFYCGDSAQKIGLQALAADCFEQVQQGRFLALSKIILSSIYAKQDKLDTALSLLRKDYPVNSTDQIKLKIAEIDLLKNYFSNQEAKQLLSQLLQQNPDNLALNLKKIELYELNNKPDELKQVLLEAQKLVESGEKLDRFNLSIAAYLRNQKHYQMAVDWLDQAILLNPEHKELLYTRALFKEPLGLFSEMITEFKSLLALYPEDLNIKNALGYTLADSGVELDYAQALIDSAYQGLPDNAAVIDSKGWIAYRLGNLQAAKEYLTRAFQLSPSAEGAAHLGEVLWKNTETQAAKMIFNKGMQLDPENKVLLDTLERLNIAL